MHTEDRYQTSATIADSSQISKIFFLRNYHKARIEAIAKKNAVAGFKAAGLWPENMTKALMNPMVTDTSPSRYASCARKIPVRTYFRDTQFIYTDEDYTSKHLLEYQDGSSG
jgi:hypothetical protein